MEKLSHYRAMTAQKVQNLLEKGLVLALYRRKGKALRLVREIRYDLGENKRSRCEFISLKEYGKRRPVFIYIHGGGWVSGLKKARRFYCYEYAEKGYFVVNCDYEYAPQKTHPYQLQQIFNLIDMLVLRQDELNIDTNQIIIAGDSAGAYLAAMVAGIATSERYEDLGVRCIARGYFNISVTVLLCGAYNVSNLVDSQLLGMRTFLVAYCDMTIGELIKNGAGLLDLFNIITCDFPPSFIIKAENDPLLSESQDLERMLGELGVEYGSYLATGMLSQHCFPLMCRTRQGKECLDTALGFIEDYVDMYR